MSRSPPSPPLPEGADVVVVGSGPVAFALALELARRGIETALLADAAAPSRDGLGPAGFVDAQARPEGAPETLRDLSLLSRHLFGDWVESLEGETGCSCEYDVRGGLAVALTEAEEVVLDRALDWQRERALPFEVLAGEEVRAREPALAGSVRAAFFFPGDGQVSAPRLLRALALAARRAGVTVAEGVPVAAVRVESGSVSGIETAWGLVRAEAVVNAAGARAGLLAGAPPLPVVPVRSTYLLLDAAGDPERLTRFVHGGDCGLVPGRDGTLVVTAPGRGDGLDPRLTAEETAELLVRAGAVVPATSAYAVLSGWALSEAVTPDGLPLLGETAIPGLLAAAGEGRGGLLLVPAAALLVAELLTGRTPPLSCAPFSPARFGL